MIQMQIKARLMRLENRLKREESYILVRDEDGRENEIRLDTWLSNPCGMFVRFTRGFDPNYRDIDTFLELIDKEAVDYD